MLRRVDFYLDAWKAKEYGLIDEVIGAAARPAASTLADNVAEDAEPLVAARERPPT